MASATFVKCKKPCKGLLGGEENLKPRALKIYSGATFHNVPNSEKNFYAVLPRVRRDLVEAGRKPLKETE